MGADSDEGYISFCVETESSQYDDSQDSTFVSSTGAKVTGRVNSKTGGEAYYIIRFAGPPKDAIVSDAQQDGNKDAEKRKKLLNDIEIPDVTKGKTTEELIEDILYHEKEHHGIDWRAAMKEGPRSMGNAVLKAHGRLHKMRKAMNQHEVDSLKSMGLLDAKGIAILFQVHFYVNVRLLNLSFFHHYFNRSFHVGICIIYPSNLSKIFIAIILY